MDLLGIAALGGLERITIVFGAIVIGYWGFKLYTGGKTAGLVFMGLSFVVLVGALATGGSHLRQVGEGVQLATLEQPVAPAQTPAPAEPATVPEPSAPAETAPLATAPDATESAAAEPVPADAPATAATAEPATEPAMAEVTSEAPAAAEEEVVRLATGQELGGRIVSVKSENVSLEWSSDSD